MKRLFSGVFIVALMCIGCEREASVNSNSTSITDCYSNEILKVFMSHPGNYSVMRKTSGHELPIDRINPSDWSNEGNGNEVWNWLLKHHVAGPAIQQTLVSDVLTNQPMYIKISLFGHFNSGGPNADVKIHVHGPQDISGSPETINYID